MLLLNLLCYFYQIGNMTVCYSFIRCWVPHICIISCSFPHWQYVPRDNAIGRNGKEKSTYVQVHKRDDQLVSEKPEGSSTVSGSVVLDEGRGTAHHCIYFCSTIDCQNWVTLLLRVLFMYIDLMHIPMLNCLQNLHVDMHVYCTYMYSSK